MVSLALFALLAVAAGSVEYLPTHDGPQHVFVVHVANHFDTPGTGWSDWLEPNLPITNHGFAAVFGPLDAWLPWPIALRIALVVMTLAWAVGAWLLVRSIRPGRGWLGLALAAAAFQWTLYMGFFSFYLASAFGLFVLAYACGRPLDDVRSRLVLALLLLIQAFLHVMTAALTGVVLVVLFWMRAAPRQSLRALSTAALLGLPAFGVAAATLWVRLAETGSLELSAGAGSVFAPMESTPWWALGKCFMAGPVWRAWPLTLLAIAAGVLAWRRQSELSAEEKALAVSGGLLLLAAAVMPLHVPSWEFFSVRFLPLSVCALVATLPLERVRIPAVRRGCVISLCLFAFAATGWAAHYNRELFRRSRPALAGLEAGITRAGWRLTIVLDPLLGRAYDNAEALVPFAAPLLNLGKLYATEQGGIPSFVFAFDRATNAIRVRPERVGKVPIAASPGYSDPILDPERGGGRSMRQAVTAYLAARATHFEDVIVYGRPEDTDYLLSLGFEVDWRHDGLALLHFVGCPLSIRFPPGSDPGARALIELGWLPALSATHQYWLHGAVRDEDGSLTLTVRQSCGGTWLRVDPKTGTCEGADEEGRLRIPPGGEHRVVECRLMRVDVAVSRP